MRAPRGAVLALTLAAVLLVSGCQSTPGRRRLASSEPSLAPSTDNAVASTPPSQSVTFVDRHPLFSKPRDYYESSGDNRLVKAAAATVIGIPAGVFGELKQIVVGRPPETRY